MTGYTTRKKRITEDSPRWRASKMGNKTGWENGKFYKNGKPVKDARNYGKGRGRPD